MIKLGYTSHMSHSPLRVSVIIPAYNEANNIIELIHKIQDILQDTAHEILVIDDGSDDESALLSESAGAKVIRHPYNIGNGAAIKTGIRNAQGEILVMLDADDPGIILLPAEIIEGAQRPAEDLVPTVDVHTREGRANTLYA